MEQTVHMTLSGIRVLDLTIWVQGPLASIKVRESALIHWLIAPTVSYTLPY